MGYGIGLDIGIASVGWAVVELNREERPVRIIKMGSRIFDAAEQPKTGEPLAAPRRIARSMRRRLRRHRHRLDRIKHLLIEDQIISQDELDNLYIGQLDDIYALRTKALDKDITKKELARILLHIAQRRGFKSNRKTDKDDKEAGALLSAVKANKTIMTEKGYRTVGEMFYKDPQFAYEKRNKLGTYKATVQRDMVADEVRTIFARQEKHINLAKDFEDKYLEILLSQRSFDEGPGVGSPYGGDQIEKMIGNCTLEPEEKRAPKNSASFERFNLLQKINHLCLVTKGTSVSLTDEQREKIITLAYGTADLKYSKIRKELNIPEGTTFNLVYYKDNDIETSEKKEKLNCLKGYHEMRKALDKVAKGHISQLTKKQLNDAAYALTVYKTDAKISAYMLEHNIVQEDIDVLLNVPGFSKFGHLSVKACDELIPYLEKGMTYDKACEAAGIDFQGQTGDKSKLLPAQTDDMEEITSPVVRRSVSQTIKVINAIIRDNNSSPAYINIELAREMSKNFTDRKKDEKGMKESQAVNDRLMERIKSEFHKAHPTGMDLVKLKLYEEQGGVCAYSQKVLDVKRLFEPGYVEVDHIIPYSISFDDSYKNKVLVLSRENQNKGNKLPLEYMPPKQKEAFIVWTKNNVRNYRKKQILLKEKITKDDEDKFKQRNLQDTQHMSRFLYNYIRNYLQFAPSPNGRKKFVTAVNGAITSHMRKRWGINKNRANGDIHHAVDALVVACTTDGMIKEISNYSKIKENEYAKTKEGVALVNRHTGEILKKFPLPWAEFREELDARLSNKPSDKLTVMHLPNYTGINLEKMEPIFVSRMPKHKVTGAAHLDTVKGIIDDQWVVLKKSLTELKLNKDGIIENYYRPESDLLVYSALIARLKAFGNDGKKAFAEPFYKPKSDGTKGPLVRKVKIMEKSTLNVPVHQGTAVAANDSMVRIDVFKVEGDGYYFVPIYVADTLKKELPNRAVVQSKPYSEWKVMSDKNFVFSLYPNDLFKVTHNDKLKFSLINEDSSLPDKYEPIEEFVYFIKAGIASGTITVENHDGTYIISSLGLKTLKNIDKYQIDVLGNYVKVNKEKRQKFC